MNTYYVLYHGENDIYWEERKGTKLKNDYGLELYIEHRSKNNWVITEARTGFSIATGTRRRLAIKELEERFAKYGKEFIEKLITEIIKSHEKSPLFTDNPKYPTIERKRGKAG